MSALLLTLTLAAAPATAPAQESLEIDASEAFGIVEGQANTHDNSRILVGDWADNAGFRSMRGVMAFDLSAVPPGTSGVASAGISIFSRNAPWAPANPEGNPGAMVVKSLGNLEANAGFDIGAANWGNLQPAGGDVSGPELATFQRDAYDGTPGTEQRFSATDDFPAAVEAALAAGQTKLYLIVYSPATEAAAAPGKQFYRLDAYDTANNAIHPVLRLTTVAADTDDDGLEDEWELSFFPGDLTVLSGGGDFDGDGLTDLGEFVAGADPTAVDTDGDTLSDGAEVISLKTDPTRRDSDGDGLEDQDELAENPFVTDPASADTDGDGLDDGDEIAAGTDPSRPDSDGDSYDDGLEARFGADPADPGSTPGALVRGGLWRVEMVEGEFLPAGAAAVRDMIDNGIGRVGAVSRSDHPAVNFSLLISGEFFATEELYPFLDEPVAGRSLGLRATGSLFVRETGPVTLGFDAPANSGSLWLDGEELTLVEGAPAGNGRRPYTVTVELESGPHELEFLHWFGGQSGVYLYSAYENGTIDTFDQNLFELMPAFDIATVRTEDSDGDGMDDFWERFYFGDLGRDGTGDFDADGLSDLGESDHRANPTKSDTDEDGLDDGAEVDTHGTRPGEPDSDGDTLTDGAEVDVHGTDPLSADSDGDGVDDPIEVALGSDPNDGQSLPATVVLRLDQPPGFSWEDAAFWSDGQAAHAGNGYQVGGIPGLGSVLRSPPALNPSLPADALALVDGGTLRLQHFGAASLPAVTASGGVIEHGAAGRTLGLRGDLQVDGGGLTIDVQGEGRRLEIEGALVGAGPLHLTGVFGGALSLRSPLSGFSGPVLIEDIAVFNDAPGSLGTGATTLDGELWSDAPINLAGRRLTLVGEEARLQLDRDVYVSELFYQLDFEAEPVDLDGILGDPTGTPLDATWFATPDLGPINAVPFSADPGATPAGRVIFSADAEGDGMPDAWEEAVGLDPAADDAGGDGDGDGLSNRLEFYFLTALDNTDSDGDGLSDGAEVNEFGSHPMKVDSDGDGRADFDEVMGPLPSDPARADTDGDGVGDAEEVGRTPPTDPARADSDGDGYPDGFERVAGSDPLSAADVPGGGEVGGGGLVHAGLTGITRTAGGGITISGEGEAGLDYDVEFSGTLAPASWSPIASAPGGPFTFEETDARRLGLASGFYRVVAPAPGGVTNVLQNGDFEAADPVEGWLQTGPGTATVPGLAAASATAVQFPGARSGTQLVQTLAEPLADFRLGFTFRVEGEASDRTLNFQVRQTNSGQEFVNARLDGSGRLQLFTDLWETVPTDPAAGTVLPGRVYRLDLFGSGFGTADPAVHLSWRDEASGEVTVGRTSLMLRGGFRLRPTSGGDGFATLRFSDEFQAAGDAGYTVDDVVVSR